jgi:predicted helicase
MLSQHLITKPVFDALFEGYEFTKHNPVSKTMQKMLDVLDEQSLEKERESLEKFYESVRKRASGIDNAAGRQEIIVELYDKFFKTAFPRMAERLGIVYTPVPVVDFMLKSVDDILREQFGVGLTAENVHILDPFTGTGTYIVRLIQSGLIDDQDLARKFRGELHANEIVLLAYYIAAINIEEAYHARVKKDYEPFEGIVLTDTFQLSEGAGKFADESFQANSERATRQNAIKEVRVIIANPPYSAGQESQNDNNQNLKYPALDKRIELTYAEYSDSTNKNSLYNSYIRAIRWASDRVKDKGIICFVSDGSFIDGNAMSGLRKCFTDEFAAIYCFNLRGNARTSGEQRRKEKGNVFDSGSRQQIAITLLVKNLEHKGACQLFYHDIGDYLTREEKLNIVTEFQSVKKIPWENLTPNKNHDWINQRDEAFEKFVPLGLKEEKGSIDAEAVFIMYSRGVATCRDAWAYNFSEKRLAQNMDGMIQRFNEQVQGYKTASANGIKVNDFIDADAKKVNWSANLISDVERGRSATFSKENFRVAQYRPFTKSHCYFHRRFNERVYRMPVFFPESGSNNLVICFCGVGVTKDFSNLITNHLPDIQIMANAQCFGLRYFEAPEKTDEKQIELHSAQGGWRENVSEFALKEFRAAYKDAKVGKEDIFYYVYGVLHSPEYKTRFAADLKKMLPRIPFAADFWAFSQAGRDLAKIHLNYETARPYAVKEEKDELGLDESKLYLVAKMRFGKSLRTATTAAETDKTKIQYNSHITLTGIPPAAYEYIVNGKPAIEWIIDRYQMITDKDSGLTNNPNDWANEHQDPAYILNLLKRIITVSMETMKVVNGLPALNERTG